MSAPYTDDQLVVLLHLEKNGSSSKRKILEFFIVRIVERMDSKSPLNEASLGAGFRAVTIGGEREFTCNSNYFPLECDDPYLRWDAVPQGKPGSEGVWHPIDAWRAIACGYTYELPGSRGMLDLSTFIKLLSFGRETKQIEGKERKTSAAA